ncbi:MAG: hypothetical protein DHS20C16_04840 [Phycisphaerae bacterium]|nr:MAG: hypothetical protein DHS20C16_04840 [Phycisphaerae bacterium]
MKGEIEDDLQITGRVNVRKPVKLRNGMLAVLIHWAVPLRVGCAFQPRHALESNTEKLLGQI